MSQGEGETAGMLPDAVRHTALKLGCENVPGKGISELLDEIHRRDAKTHQLLVAFADAYRRWYQVQQRIGESEAEQPVSPDQDAQLAELVDRRDSSREAVLRRLKRLQRHL